MARTREEILEQKRQYYYNNRETFLKRVKEYREKYPEKRKIYTKNYRRKYPNKNREWQEKRTFEVINNLGGKCNKCGYSKIPALVFHHKKGNKEKKRDWMKKDYDLNKLLLLCANCHSLIHYKNKYGTKKNLN